LKQVYLAAKLGFGHSGLVRTFLNACMVFWGFSETQATGLAMSALEF